MVEDAPYWGYFVFVIQKGYDMKRFILTLAVSLILATMAYTQGITEISEAPTEDAAIDLKNGNSSSSLVKAEFDSDGNLEVRYDGTENVTIKLSGVLNGSLIVKSDNADYTLVLDNVSITGDKLPAVQLKSSTTATIYSEAGSNNIISDSPNNEKKGTITSAGSIIFDGPVNSSLPNGEANVSSTATGELLVNVFKKHGVKVDGGVTVNGGNLTIVGDQGAEGNMISTDMFFVMNNGVLDIQANGNVHATESKGIKVNGTEGLGTGLGYVQINGGQVNVVSVGKAITAGWDRDEDALTATTDDDPVANVYINGGVVNVETTGTPYNYSNEESLSPEGIEAKNTLYINGGVVQVRSTDDCLNAGVSIVVNGGYVYAISSANDSIDSNGTIEIHGGTVICMSSSREQAFDCDNDANFTFTGGTYVGAGNGNNMPKSSATTGYSLAYGDRTFCAGNHIAILDDSGNVIIGFVVPYDVPTLTSIVFGTQAFVSNESYTLSLGVFRDPSTDGLMPQGSIFMAQEEVVTMEMTANTVSQGIIGMNVGPGADGGGRPDFGDFGRFGGDFVGNQGRMHTVNGFNASPWVDANLKPILQSLISRASEVQLPDEVTLPTELDSDQAIQLALYILANYIDVDNLITLVQGSISNGEFDMLNVQPMPPSDGFNSLSGQPVPPNGEAPDFAQTPVPAVESTN